MNYMRPSQHVSRPVSSMANVFVLEHGHVQVLMQVRWSVSKIGGAIGLGPSRICRRRGRSAGLALGVEAAGLGRWSATRRRRRRS